MASIFAHKRAGISFTCFNWFFHCFALQYQAPDMEANNNELVRRTRSKCYYSSSGGDVKVVDNSFEATEYSLVISQPIEYTKRRVQKKTAPKPQPAQPCGQKPKITAKMLNARQKLNSISNRASKVFPSIDLDASSVPKPKPITTKKKWVSWKSHIFALASYLATYLFFSRQNDYSKMASRWSRKKKKSSGALPAISKLRLVQAI